MSKVTGYDFLSVDEDNWDDLTFEEQQRKIEEEKKKLFDSLQEIENTEYKTQSDVANYLRNQSYLEGNFDRYANLSDEKVIELGQAFGEDITGEIYEPTAGDISAFKLKQLENRLYNMDAYGIAGKDLNWGDVGETKAILDEGIAAWDDYIKNNPKARATAEWLGSELETLDNPQEFSKWILSMGYDVGSSVGFSMASAKIGGATGGLAGSFVPGVGTALGATAGAVTAGGLASSVQMGGNTLRSEYERLQQDSQLDGQQFLSMVELAKETYNKEYPDGNFNTNAVDKNGKPLYPMLFDENNPNGTVTNKTELFNLYLKDRFQKIDDNNFIMKGLSGEEAVAAATGTANWSASVGALIEQVSMAGKILKILPKGRFNPKYLTNNTFTRMNDKLKNKALLYPRSGVKNKVKSYLTYGGPKALAEMSAEATEEVLQGFNDAIASTYTPELAGKGIINGLQEMYYPPTDFWDHHGGWTQLRDEIAGGMLGSAPISAVTATKSITTLGDRAINRDILKKSKTQEGVRYAVEKGVDDKNRKTYNVVGYNTTKKDGERVVSVKADMSKLKDKEGKSLQTSFAKFDDAFNVANTYNQQEAANINQIQAWKYRDIRNGSTKVVQNDDGTFSVEIYNNDGKLFKKDEEVYNKKYKANRRNKQLTNTLETIDENYRKYKLDNTEDNEVIMNFLDNQNKKKQVFKNLDNENVSVENDNINIQMGIAAFMMEKLQNADDGARTTYNDMFDKTSSNPDEIINLIKQDNDNKILTDRGHSPDKLLTAFDETFGPDSPNPIDNFTAKRKELNNALYPQGPPKNQNKPSAIEGPDVNQKPLVVGKGDITVEEGPDVLTPSDTEGPDVVQPTLFEDGPTKKTKGKPTKRKSSVSLAKTPTDTIIKNIDELKASIPKTEEGSTQRKFAEKRLSLLEKEIERRKTEEKKAPEVKDSWKKHRWAEDAFYDAKSPEEELEILKGKRKPENYPILTERDRGSLRIKNRIKELEKILAKKKAPEKKKLPLEVTDEAIEGVSPKEEKINQTLDVAERLFKTFDGKINITTENSGAREPVAKYDPNTNAVILNLDNPDLDIDAPFHEFSHPFISMLAKDKPELFNSIYEEAIAADNTLLESIKFTYRNEIANGELDEQGIREEVIAHALDKLSKKSYQQLESLNKKNPLRKIWTAIKRFFNYIMDKYGIKKFDNAYNLLTPSTTLKEISDILVNYDNKYIIDMGDKAFQDEAIEIATREVDIASVEIAENETEAAIIAEENAFIDHMSGVVRSVKSQKDLDKAINKIIKISNKRFPHRKDKYKGTAIQKSMNYRFGIEGDLIPSNKNRIIAKIKSRVIKGLPETVKLNEKHIEKLVKANETISGEIQFRFRFVNNEKLKDPNGISNIKDLHTWPGIRKGEKENIKEFAKTIKVNSMKNIDIINAYILYTNKKLGLSYVVSKNYSEALNYRAFFPELAEEDTYEPGDDLDSPINEARPEVHRVLIVKDRAYKAGHTFPELKTKDGKFGPESGSPLGWYTVAYGGGRVLLHEFQSDVLMEILGVIQKANLNKGKVKLDAKKPIPNLLGLLEKNTIESLEVKRTLDNEKKFANDPINNYFRADTIKIQAGFKDSIFEGIPYKFKLSNYQFEFDMDYSENIGNIVDTFISQFKLDIVESNLEKNKITLEHVKLVIDRLVNLNEHIEYSNPKVDAYGPQSVDMFISELEHRLDNLKGRKYTDFQELKIQKYIMELMVGYGNYKPHTNQERADLLEFYNYYARKPVSNIEFEDGEDGYSEPVKSIERFYDIKNNEDVFINFPNKKNSFYRFLLQLDNQQRTPEYSKPQFVYNPDSIYKAIKSTDMIIGIMEDVEQISDLINKNGKPSAKLKKNRNKMYLTYRDASSYLNNYIQGYIKDRNEIENYEAFKTIGIEARPVLLKELLKRYKYYNQEYSRKISTIALLSEFANANYSSMEELTGKEEALDLENVVDNIPELINAKKEISITDNWFENLIMHSILHSNVTKPGKEIYINTGSAISLIEGNDAAMSVYANKKEHQWKNLHDVVNRHEMFKTEFFEEITQWFLKNKKDFKNPNAIDSAINALKVVGWSNSLYGYSNSYLSENTAKDISEAQDIILDFVINESRNNILLHHNINHKLSQKSSSFTLKWGDKSVITEISIEKIAIDKNINILSSGDVKYIVDLQSLEVNDRISVIKEHNKQLKKLIEKQFKDETDAVKKYLYNKHAIFDRPIIEGVFKKALNNVSKDKLNGVEIELVYPKWSATPLYKVTITDDKKLVPVKWKKKLQTIQAAKDVPTSVESLETNLKTKIELENLNVRTEEYRIIKGFFDSAWRNMNAISGKNKIDIEDFREVMNHVITEQLVPAFEQWWENKFKNKLNKDSSLRDLGKKKYKWVNKDIINEELQEQYTDWAEGSSVSQMLENGVTSEKVLSLNDLKYFKALKISITDSQVDAIYIMAKRAKSYNEWKDLLTDYLSVSLKITPAQDSELKKIYSRVKYSTVRTNRDMGVSNERDNFFVKVTTKYDRKSQSWNLVKIDVRQKGPENVVTKNSNNNYEKVTLFESNNEMNLFKFISGGDVYGNFLVKDDNGNYIEHGPRGQLLEGWRKKYGFFNKEELTRLENYLRTMNYTIAFSRGDSDTLGFVKITDDHKNSSKNVNEYWEKQFESLVNTTEDLEYLESLLPDLTSGTDMDRAAAIAIHEALTKVFPKYLLDRNPSNIYKRIKIPFTPVTINKEMPPIRIDRIDPNDIEFITEQNPDGYDAVQNVPGLGEIYIGDGNTLTSQSLFDLFYEYFGLARTTAKAKTVIYHNDGIDAIAIKHQHVLARRHLKIKSKSTKKILYTVDNNRVIRDSEGAIVHMLATDDEIKIGSEAFAFGSMEVPGKSIGFIKFDETSKQNVKHIMQWYNYVQDPKVISQFIKTYGPVIGNAVTESLSMGILDGDLNSAKGILKFLQDNSGRENVGFALTALELAGLGAGVHPSLEHVLDVLVQTQSLLPALNIDQSIGSIYDVSMDVTGQLDENEVGLAIQNSRGIKKLIASKIGKPASDLKITEINKWLSQKDEKGNYINNIYVMVTRSPVAYAGGAYMARVNNLHTRRSLAEININDLRLKLEGDGDGDEVHIELLDEETTEVYKGYMDTIKTEPLNLNLFKSKTPRKISTKEQKLDTISSLIAGQIAIAEIANVNAVYGMLSNTFNSFKFQGIEIKIRKPDDKVKFPEAYFDGKKGAWDGTLAEYLRIWLQAAVDNNEFGLLYDWNYSQDKLLENLFEGPLPDGFMSMVKPILDYYKQVLSIRRGYNFEKGNFRLSDTLRISEQVYDKALDRESFNVQEGEATIFSANVKNRQLTPYELVAVAPYRMWQKISKENNMFGFNGTPYKISDRVHRNAHKYGRDFLEANLENTWIQAKDFDLESGNWDGVNEAAYLKTEVEAGTKYIKGTTKQPGMGIELYRMLKELKKLGPQTIDRNDDFIAWKEKWDSKFKGLSKVAQVAATISFLRGYLTLNQKLELTKGTQHPKIFPSVSKKETEISLLEPNIIEKFFEKYHEYINKKDPMSLNKVVENSSEHVDLIKSVMRICGG